MVLCCQHPGEVHERQPLRFVLGALQGPSLTGICHLHGNSSRVRSKYERITKAVYRAFSVPGTMQAPLCILFHLPQIVRGWNSYYLHREMEVQEVEGVAQDNYPASGELKWSLCFQNPSSLGRQQHPRGKASRGPLCPACGRERPQEHLFKWGRHVVLG